MPLSVKTIENLKPKTTPYKRSDGGGLTLHIMPNGKRYWRWRYRFSGKPKTLTIGEFASVSLHNARLAAAQARESVRQGIDPSAQKKRHKREKILNAKNTFQAIAEEWHARNEDRWNARHAQNILSRLKRDVFPIIGNTPISELETTDVTAAIKLIEDRGAGEMARRALQNCGQVFRYAVQTGRAKYDATSGLKGFLKPRIKAHYKTIEVNQLPKLVRKIRQNDARLFKQTRIALELMMLTFVRTSELINARWSEFDFENSRWTIPAERMKKRREHIIPLSKQAKALLEELQEISGKREHLFPSIPRPFQPMCNATLLRALEKLGYHKLMTGHGFRALATTALQEKLDVDFRYIDRQLAHIPKGAVNQAYDRAQFIDQRTKMMQDWADYIDKIVKS